MRLVFLLFILPACAAAPATLKPTRMRKLQLAASKCVGSAVVGGACLYKLPQLALIANSGSMEGISPLSVYAELPMFSTAWVYHHLNRLPFTTYGDHVANSLQSAMMVAALPVFGGVPPAQVAAYALGLGLLTAAQLALPRSRWQILNLAQAPLVLAARVPQIVANFQQGHTGQLSAVTIVLLFAGSLARVFTTVVEAGADWGLLVNYGIGAICSGTLLAQIAWYASATALLRQG